MKSSDSQDGKQVKPSAHLSARFAQTGRFGAKQYLHAIFDALCGAHFRDSPVQRRRLEDSIYPLETLLDHAPLYNELLGEKPARRLSRDSGKKREKTLRGIDGVLTAALAERFPARFDPRARIDGETSYTDTIGEVKCDSVLRVQQLGLIAAVGGVYMRRERSRLANVVELDGAINLSARQIHHLISGRHPGGEGLRRVRVLLRGLATAQFSGAVKRDVDDDHRDKELRGNPIKSIERWVAGENGPELAPMDDPRPDSREVAATYRVQLHDWYREQLDGPERELVYLTLAVWRRLPQHARRIYAFVQSAHARHAKGKGRKAIYFYNAPALHRQLGWHDERRYGAHSDSLYLRLLEVMRIDQSYEFVHSPKPWSNTRFYRFKVFLRQGDDLTSRLREGSYTARRLSKRWLDAESDDGSVRTWLYKRSRVAEQHGFEHPLLV